MFVRPAPSVSERFGILDLATFWPLDAVTIGSSFDLDIVVFASFDILVVGYFMFGSSFDLWIFLYYWNKWIYRYCLSVRRLGIYGSVDLWALFGSTLDILLISSDLLWIFV